MSQNKNDYYLMRGTNAIEVDLGTSIMNGDLSNPIFEVYSKIGYKRAMSPYLAIGLGYNKFNLAFKDIYNEGFMSFDLNLEYLLLPHKRLSPYVFIGSGLNAANYFEQKYMKIQSGLGMEYIITNKWGVKLFSDYNYVFSDALEGLEFGRSNDVYWRIALGLNYYFGGHKKNQELNDSDTSIIKSNPILH